MTDLLLYHAIPSRGMIVRWMLEEIGRPYDVRLLDLAAQEHKAPEYLAVNPMGKVPALRHGEVVVTETAAICAYLAEAFPDAGLDVPAGSPARAAYLRWLFFGPVTAEPAILWKALGKVSYDVDYEPFATIDAVAATLADAVRGREYLVDDRFTTTDVVIGSTVFWGLRLTRVLPERAELVAYWEALERRPAWQRAQAADRALAAGKGPG